MDDPFSIDVDSLTLGEYAAIEELTGWTYGQVFDALAAGDLSSPSFVLALVFIQGHRADPDYTIVDAGAIPLIDLGGEVEAATVPDDGKAEDASA